MTRKEKLLAIMSPILFLVMWHLLRMVGIIDPNYLPGPIDVVSVFFYTLSDVRPDGSTLLQHALSSVFTSTTGFLLSVIIGVPLGLFMGWRKSFEIIFKPTFDVFRQIPSPAWIPFSIFWFGIGVFQRGFIVWQSAFVPIVINTYYGMKNVPRVYIQTATIFGFSPWEIFMKVYIPAALPFIFTGIVTGYGVSWAVLTAAEFLASTDGLGYMIWSASRLGRADLIVLGMLLIGLIGTGLTSIIQKVEKYFIKYQ